MFKFKKKQTKIIASVVVLLLAILGIFRNVNNFVYQFVIVSGCIVLIHDVWEKKAEEKE
ncbi:MAG: hypothetical protein ACRCV7_06765 [Culicoidibacterales bacterium]